MARKYTTYTPELKLKVAMAACREDKTVNEIASEHPCQVSDWKKQLKASADEVFPRRRQKQAKNGKEDVGYLQQQIGKLMVELEWLKKNRDVSSNMRKSWISAEDPDLSTSKQLELACLSKASYYYQPVSESALNLELMDLIDEAYTEFPFYGSRRILAGLRRKGFDVNRKRVIRLMNKMGLQAIFPNRHLTKLRDDHVKYPYLLKDLLIDRPNQVWATDITYIRVGGGYFYLTAVMVLVHQVCALLAPVQHAGCNILPRSFGGSS